MNMYVVAWVFICPALSQFDEMTAIKIAYIILLFFIVVISYFKESLISTYYMNVLLCVLSFIFLNLVFFIILITGFVTPDSQI